MCHGVRSKERAPNSVGIEEVEIFFLGALGAGLEKIRKSWRKP